MLAVASPVFVWFMVALVIAWFVIGCAKVIGYEYHNAVLWHDLRVQVQNLRRDQMQKISRLQRDQGAAVMSGGRRAGRRGPKKDAETEPVAEPVAEEVPEAAEVVELAEAA